MRENARQAIALVLTVLVAISWCARPVFAMELISNGQMNTVTGIGPGNSPIGWGTAGPHGGIHVSSSRSDGTAPFQYYPIGGWGSSPGGQLFQTVTTVVGATYRLQFSAGIAFGSVNWITTITAEGASGNALNQVLSGTGTSPRQLRNFSFTALDASTTIRFTLTSATSDIDWDIDAVSLVLVDTTSPTVAIATPSEAQGPFTATFTFSEDVTGFALGDIVAGNATISNFVSTSASVYTATISPGSNGGVTIDVGAGVAQDLAGNNNTAATRATINFIDETFVRTRTQRVISNFLSRRSDQIAANDPDIDRRLTSRRGGNGRSGPVNFAANGDLRNNQVNFATSLRQIVNAGAAAKIKRRQGLLSLGAAGPQSTYGIIADEGFDIWAQGKLVHTENGTADQELGLFYVGADYKFSSSFLLGVLAQFDWSDGTDATQDTAAEGRGWLVGPYLVARLHENLVFDGRVAFGRSDNDVRAVGTATDSFDGERWLAKGQLTGLFEWGKWEVTPSAGIIYFEEEQKSFTTSTGVFIPSQTVALGRFTFGPKISTRFAATDGSTVSPYVSLQGLWDFEQAEQVDLATGLAIGTDDFRGRVEAGLSITAETGVTLSGEGFYDGIGADNFEVYGGSVKMTFPLNR